MSRFLVDLKRPMLAILIMLLLQFVAGLVLIVASFVVGELPRSDGNIPMFNVPLMAISLIAADVIIALVCMALFRRKQYTRSRYVPSTSTWKQNLVGLLGCLFGVMALDLMTELIGIPNLMEAQMLTICRNPWGVAAIALAAPVGEEILFRWGIMGHLLHRNRGVAQSILVSALLFGLIHLNPAQVFFAMAMGILLGMLYWKTGNLLLPILLHMLNNSVACLQVWICGDDIYDYSMSAALGGPTVAWSLVGVCTVVCVGLMWWYAVSRPRVLEVRADIPEGEYAVSEGEYSKTEGTEA